MTQRFIMAAVIAALAGRAFGANETYVIDPTHTYPSFEFGLKTALHCLLAVGGYSGAH